MTNVVISTEKNKAVGSIKKSTYCIKLFIDKAKDIHKNKYCYEKTDYKNAKTKVSIFCNTCKKDFKQTPDSHLRGSGCPCCGAVSRGKKLSSNKIAFVEVAKRIHGDKYCYNLTSYLNNRTKVSIFCNKCKSVFQQAPTAHLQGGGCKKCSISYVNQNNTSNTEDFIKKAQKLHGDRFCYNRTKYEKSIKKVFIYCKICDIFFEQTPNAHLSGKGGCLNCVKNKLVERNTAKGSIKSNECFIKRARNIHNHKYCYKETLYKDGLTKVRIFCNTCSVAFNQRPSHHLMGAGCPLCRESKGEKAIRKCLIGKIDFETQKSFKEYKGVSRLRFDFYIPSLNICIEHQGVQHYKAVNYFGGEKKFIENKERDQRKRDFCMKNNIKLIVIPYWDYDNIERILKGELKKTKKLDTKLQLF